MEFDELINRESAREMHVDEGGIIPSTRRAAFRIVIQQDLPIPVLIAVPHAGRDYPASLTAKMREPDFSQLRLEDRLVDRIARPVAAQTGAGLLVAHAPRAMLDLNRATEDVDWEMVMNAAPDGARHSAANRRARSGLGLIPRRLPRLGEIWNSRLSEAELSARIRQIHTPYHTALAAALARLRDRWGAALLIDLHSMPPLKEAQDQAVPPRFVVGDRFGASANDRISARALQLLSENGQIVAHNRPYAGGYVLDRHAAPGRGIHAIQLEICRSLYLDREMRELSGGADELTEIVTRLVRGLGDEIARLSRGNSYAQAAE